MPTRLVALSVLAVLLSGCAGGSAKTDASPIQPSSDVQATGSPIEGTSSIKGVVVDDQTVPLADVAVAVKSVAVGTILQAATDDGGQFAITNIVAGQYQVFATKLGYDSVSKAVTVAEGETSTLTLALAPIVVEQVFHQTIGPYVGYVACGMTQPGVRGVYPSYTRQCPGQVEPALGDAINDFEFELVQANMQAIQGELRWTPGAVGTSQRLSLFLMPDEGGGSNWYCTNAGTSPVTMIYHPDEEKDLCSGRGGDPDPEIPEMETPLVLTVYLPFDSVDPDSPGESSPPNVVFQQRYESIATVFYGKEPEPAFSAFNDA